MKKCTKCKVEKPLEDFQKRYNVAGVNVGTSRCKKCFYEYTKNYNKTYRVIKKGEGWCVYILPKENYAGMTKGFYYRMSYHKSKGKNIEGARIIEKTTLKSQARELEALLHSIGYKGGWEKN